MATEWGVQLSNQVAGSLGRTADLTHLDTWTFFHPKQKTGHGVERGHMKLTNPDVK